MRLDTARLLLRPAEPRDRSDLYRLEQDPEVMWYLNGGRPTPWQPPQGGGSGFFMPRGGEPGVWAVIVRDTGDFAGWVALDEHGGDDALGYRLLRAQWGRGLATEAVRAVLLHAFERVGLASVAGITMAVNLRSRRVMERSGMHLSKIVHADPPLPLPGSEEGEAVYSAERDDWLAAHRLTARDGGKT